MATITVLSAVGALVLACFVKAVAITFLGYPRSNQTAEAKEKSWGMIAAQLLLISLCIVVSMFVPQVLLILKPICDECIHTPTNIENAFTIPQAGIALALAATILLIYALLLKRSSVRRYITWDCGFGDLSERTQVNTDSFAQPLARILRPLLRYSVSLEISGNDRRHFPERIKVEPRIVSILENRVYLPLVSIIGCIARALAKMQASSIHLYLVYVCLTLLVLLVAGTRL